jgi:hypothetical protein
MVHESLQFLFQFTTADLPNKTGHYLPAEMHGGVRIGLLVEIQV